MRKATTRFVLSTAIALTLLLVLAVGIAQAAVATKVFWGDSSAGSISERHIGDGSSNTPVTGATNVLGIALDDAAGKVYWVSQTKIERANIDGSSREDVVTGLGVPKDIALDTANNQIYWTDDGADSVQRCSLASLPCTAQNVATSLDTPEGITVDTTNDEVYWGDDDLADPKIQKCSTTGSMPCTPSDVLTGRDSVSDIALDITNSKVYWVDYWNGEIHRDNLAGGNDETLYTLSELTYDIGAIALDVDDNKLYWTETHTNTAMIRRSDLDGSSDADLITGLGSPYGLALRRGVAIGNMVWGDDDGNGSLNGAEAGIGSVTLYLYPEGSTPGDGSEVMSTTTDVAGTYVFSDVSPGKYFVAIDTSVGSVGVYTRSSTGGGHDPDMTGDHTAASGDDGTVSAVPGFVVSQVFTATAGAQTTSDTGDPAWYPDNSSYMTIDFGFTNNPTAVVLVKAATDQGPPILLLITLPGLAVLALAGLAIWRRRAAGR